MVEALGHRRLNWRRYLCDVFEEVRQANFDWSAQGGVNCISGWCDCVAAFTDPPWDPGQAHRDTFDDEAAAMAIIEAAGGWPEFMDSLFGAAARLPPLESEEGDLWLLELPLHGLTCGMRMESAVYFKWHEAPAMVRIPFDRAAGMDGAMAWAAAR